MILKLRRSGGFAGIKPPPMMVDTHAIDPTVAERIEHLIKESKFHTMPARSTAPAHPDGFQFTLDVSAAGSNDHCATFDESDMHPCLGELINLIRTLNSRH